MKKSILNIALWSMFFVLGACSVKLEEKFLEKIAGKTLTLDPSQGSAITTIGSDGSFAVGTIKYTIKEIENENKAFYKVVTAPSIFYAGILLEDKNVRISKWGPLEDVKNEPDKDYTHFGVIS